MKLHWEETVIKGSSNYRPGHYVQVKMEADLIFLEHEMGHTTPRSADLSVGSPDFEAYHPSTYQRPSYTVAIVRVKGRKGIFSGVARYSGSEGEIFNWQRGQKLALQRALKLAIPQRESREKAWLSYRLQVEMVLVKAEVAREEHKVRMIEMQRALDKAKQGLQRERDMRPAGIVVLSTPSQPPVKYYICGCSDIGPVCPLHSAPPKEGGVIHDETYPESSEDGSDPNPR